MGKLPVISGVLVMILCSLAQAHRPIFSEKAATDPNTAVLISQPAISQVIYREITDDAEQVWLAFDVNEGFGLFIQIGVPVLDRLKDFRPSMLVVGPGLPEDNLPFKLPAGAGANDFPTDAIEDPRLFHEHFTGTDSWILRSDSIRIPKSGRYYVVAYVPSGKKGKLWLSVGKKESFGLAEWAQFGEWKKKIRKFHEVSEAGKGLRIPILSDIADMLRSAGRSGAEAKKPDPNAPLVLRELGDGFVQGDVVSYSYVPNRHWTLEQAKGILPYLCEYELMAWSGDKPLEAFHEENIRRIDLASQWSTAIMFYARRLRFQDEIINLMIRAYQHRQLFVLRDYWKPGDDHEPFDKTLDILETLWANRDKVLTNPEGDKATGRQLINNILMVKTGDEYFCTLGTRGLETIYRTFQERIQQRRMDTGERPFRHIKAWYNMVAWAAWNYGSCWASGPDDLKHNRQKLPANTEFIGVDTYDYWWYGIPYDPVLAENKDKVLERVQQWHRIRTKYYPEGIRTKVCTDAENPETWTPQCWSDTHALMNALEFAKADNSMMIYIGLSSSIVGRTYTTPIETMDAYYENLKAGPWVGLSWWYFDDFADMGGTIHYVDKDFLHYTPQNPEGIAYSQEQLNKLHDEFIASRMRMFEDVVYNQFGPLNPRDGRF